MPTLTDSDDGRTIDIQVGETIELHLSENAAAGYRWAVDQLDPALFEPASREDDYRATTTGSGGVAVFRIAARDAGTGTLALKYWRPWEGDAGVLKRFSLTVTARR